METFLAFDFGQRSIDRSGEGWVVQLDREVVAALFGDFLPGCSKFDVMWSST
ncbi:hypothetical protein J2S28_005054 [Rhizobium sp. SLBN-94]|jgi:hypothetical protein|nr:hypothetical protein [Rhizobium sp. SLBN-94]